MRINGLFKIKVLCVIFLITAKSAYSQSCYQVIAFADSLLKEKKYSQALNEYRRAFFFSPDSNKYVLAARIADCYLAQNKYAYATSFCDSSIRYAPNKIALESGKLKKITCLILENKLGDALIQLKDSSLSANKHIESKRNFLIGMINLQWRNTDMAEDYLLKSISYSDSGKVAAIRSLFDEYRKNPHFNPLSAGLMSAFVPGSGQALTGHYLSGINSLALLAGLTYIGYSIPPLSVLTLPMFARYYMGGILKSHSFAKQNQNIQLAKFTNDVIRVFPEEEIITSDSVNLENPKFGKYVLDSDNDISIIISSAFLLYKGVFSSQDVDACVFTPSCSVYMMETIKKHGAFKGLLDGTDRLLRCHGFANHKDYEVLKTTGKLYDKP